MSKGKESKLKKIFEKAEQDAKEVGHGIKKGAVDVEKVIEKGLGGKGDKQAKQ